MESFRAAEGAGEGPPVVQGQVLQGKFRVERIIGEGGMGIVAEATHLQLEERVALKFLRREVMRMPEVVARFDAEARAAVKLKSEHVARVRDVGKTEDGIPFMVMDLLDGEDLGRIVSANGPLGIREAVDYVIQACEGVGEAHARGIVHRDLKPENLFLVKRGDWGVVKVLDFGISKAVLVGPTSVDMQSSQTSNIMGSPFYMSPEQLRSTKSVDHRADIWSLGVVLFELLTGTTIYDETKEFTELVADILESPHRQLCAFRADAPSELEVVINHCLEKDRARRYQNVAELAVALLPFAPRRARVNVERTAAITRAAGLITDPDFRLPPSNFPGAPTDPVARGAALTSTMPRLPPPPSIDSMSGIRDSKSPISAPLSSTPVPPQQLEAIVPSSAPIQEKKRLSPMTLAFIGLLLAAAWVTIAILVLRSGLLTGRPQGTAPEAQLQEAKLVQPAPIVSAAPSSSAVAVSSAAVDGAFVAANSASAKPVIAPPWRGRIQQPLTTSQKPPTPPPSQTSRPALDIQMER